MTGFLASIVEAYGELRVNKGRILLSLIGVAFSVFALTTVMGGGGMLGGALQQSMERSSGIAAWCAAGLRTTPLSSAPWPPPRTVELADRLVDELSGGQRQRVWVAMLLAQETELMLLDEPTTFLDIAHQYELLELLRGLHEHGRTFVVVLHDLNQAARYATDLVVMHEGEVVTTGAPQDVVTPALLRDVFSLDCLVVPDPASGTPMVVPTVCTR